MIIEQNNKHTSANFEIGECSWSRDDWHVIGYERCLLREVQLNAIATSELRLGNALRELVGLESKMKTATFRKAKKDPTWPTLSDLARNLATMLKATPVIEAVKA